MKAWIGPLLTFVISSDRSELDQATDEHWRGSFHSALTPVTWRLYGSPFRLYGV
jgi:hypothetical protein